MKITNAIFETSVLAEGAYPPKPLPEFAFIGRSNVGKSSLVNLLTRSKGLAKVSATPGRTRLVTFFRVDDTWRLVDLPGYGYDAGPKKDRAQFQEATLHYLARRPNLACVFVLIDSRLPPQKIDLEFITWLTTTNVPWRLVFTKADKEPGRVQANVSAFVTRLHEAGLPTPETVVSSAKTKAGEREILRAIAEVLKGGPPRNA